MKLYPKHALVLAALFAVTIPAAAQQLADTEQRDQPRQHATREGASPNAFSPDVVSKYESMRVLGINARRELYSSFSREMMRDLWLMHIDRFVAGNPALTPDQASVISDARALIGFGLFENTAPGEAGRERWLEALSALEAHGRLAFSPPAARLLLFEPGGPSEGLPAIPPHGPPPQPAPARRVRGPEPEPSPQPSPAGLEMAPEAMPSPQPSPAGRERAPDRV